ncbi:iron complex outermembrane receptor protein [Inhella inkyongensis]|uniref:Iron complex outermembrane receptor protein n=1 Tax=Inhella inkyongensis TaxID=392593 RepID=A0A840S4X0_9BURK|nr:TonB-dependent siderophore receptor [Inhella inkyongensis]MBB5203549.1 iron complex outermembrane receptor protein [Inhella inkyongensis]
MKKTFTLSLLALASAALAQEQLPAVTVQGRHANAPVSVGGFGDTPNARLPLQALRIDAERLSELGLDGLSALPLLDASISDSYNSLGYVAKFSVRGFEVDTRFNLRRDGLPINGETVLPLFNKAALEVLKGASGLQAGTSAPGGLINLITKRPDQQRLDLSLGWESHDSRSAAIDWSQRFGPQQTFGLRINASVAELDPWLHKAQGHSHGFALAADWRLSRDTLIEAEVETHHQSQPSQPGFSLLGGRLPSIHEVDRRRNLNDAAWRLPVVFDGDYASLRLQQRLNPDWLLTLHAGTQRARTDDRVAFPFGCSAEDNYSRYCADGSFDLYDFRSENERRDSDALRATVDGKLQFGGLQHQVRAELLHSRYQLRPQRQAYNWAGSGSVFGGGSSQADPSLTDENTLRDERSTELALSDQVQFGALELFAGLRHSRIEREAVRTDGSRATAYAQGFTTPWIGATWALTPQLRAYASAGQGIESEVIPNRSRYKNPGQALPALRSHQLEMGLKAGSQTVDWSIAAFEVRRPQWSDIGACSSAVGSCERKADGEARHRGIEAQADLKWQGGGLLASAMGLQARRQGAQDPTLNGKAPVNVPQLSLRLGLRQEVLQGLTLQTSLVHEGRRQVLPDNSLQIAGWTRMDLNARFQHTVGQQQWTWRAGVDNLFDHKAWKESPYTFGHSYLFPLAPRTWSAGLNIAL